MDEKNEEFIRKLFVLKEIGTILSARRKQSRKKIDTISKVLKIKSSHLIAIEEGSEDYFSEKIYQIGFIKTYAKYLKIDLTNELNFLASSKKNTIENEKNRDFTTSNIDSKPNIKNLVPAISIMLILFFCLNEYKKSRDPEYLNKLETDTDSENDGSEAKIAKNLVKLNEQKIEYRGEKKNDNLTLFQQNENEIYQSEKNIKEVDEISYNTKINLGEINLKINFLFETWMQIFDIDNNIIKSGIFYAGEGFSLKIDDENMNYFIDTGNSGGFEIILNNELLPSLGSLGEVRKNVSIVEVLEVFEKQKKEN